MDYEKLYKEALEKAQIYRNHLIETGDDTNEIEYIFPELVNNNERIRKSLIKYLESLDDKEIRYGVSFKEMRSWLEKQGEEKVYSVWVGGSEINDYYLTEKEAKKLTREYKENGYDDVIIEKQGEQKSAWSEEDEYQINTILQGLDLKRELYKKEGNKVEEERYNTQYNWLKSLKERVGNFDDGYKVGFSAAKYNQWKPSDEQIEALLKLEEMHVLEHEKNQENAHLYMVVKSIREQLLKLRDE